MDSLTELYCFIDDFCLKFEPLWHRHLLGQGQRKRCRSSSLSLSELMTLVILFQQLRFRQFKSFYNEYALRYLRKEFPSLPSYSRCIQLMPRCTVPLSALFHLLKGQCTGISIADSTPLKVCHNLRIKNHRVFSATAERAKSSTGWFYGLKLHAVINHRGQLLGIKVTPANVDDRSPIPQLCSGLFGKLFADKGYLSKKLKETLKQKSIELITKYRKNMGAPALSAFDQAILKRRSLIETVFNELKNLCQIEHTRHRSVSNFMVNLMGGIIAYCLMPKKPKIDIQTTSIVC